LNPRSSVVCQYCSVSLGRYRICSRGHANRWDAQFCGVCGDVFLSPSAPLRPFWDYAAEGLFSAGVLALIVYFLWELRGVFIMSLVLLLGLLLIMQWLFRPFGKALHLWMPWIFLFRLLRKR
ncbi:MAG: hypothetical protein L0Z46_12890, partial [Nitrospiraceae bacterium]|nr:hypothetical protein [Nitrospiraceae bacterium]